MLTERTLLEKVEAFPDGKINVYRVIVIERDGKEVSRVPEIEKIDPGDKLPAEGVVRAVAHALWGATDLMKAVLPPTSKKGRLYRTKGKDTTHVPTLAGPVSAPVDIKVNDPRASQIKPRGADQRGIAPSYVGSASGFAMPGHSGEPPVKIRHRGKEQR
jgi:hypothetical protein